MAINASTENSREGRKGAGQWVWLSLDAMGAVSAQGRVELGGRRVTPLSWISLQVLLCSLRFLPVESRAVFQCCLPSPPFVGLSVLSTLLLLRAVALGGTDRGLAVSACRGWQD